MPPSNFPTLLPAAIVLLTLGAILAAVENFFVGLAILSFGLYIGSLALRSYLTAIPRCPGCNQPTNPASTYCSACGTPLYDR